MKITFFGTTTLLFDDGTDQILFDCHFTRPSLPKYLGGSEGTNKEIMDELFAWHHIDRLKAIFISHTHHDHVMDAPYAALKTGAVIYGSSSAMNVAKGGDVPESQQVCFKAGETYTVGQYKIQVLASKHSKPTAFNNDLGVPIDHPIVQPAKLHDYKEGGSYDFYVEAEGKKILIRPSFNYIEGQLNGYQCDVLFLGIFGLGKADRQTETIFFHETVEKVRPALIVPLHWDNFFVPLDKPTVGMLPVIEKTEESFFKLAKRCEAYGINCILQIPRTSIEI
jgi:L-ascorbate metabolism protein UlaG (beta-lactamase superfamily)